VSKVNRRKIGLLLIMADMNSFQCPVVEVEMVFDGLLIKFSDERCAFYSIELLRAMLSHAEEIDLEKAS
jgi:hypothetical protein